MYQFNKEVVKSLKSKYITLIKYIIIFILLDILG